MFFYKYVSFLNITDKITQHKQKQRRFTKHQFHQGIQHKHHIPTVSGPPKTGLYIIHCNEVTQKCLYLFFYKYVSFLNITDKITQHKQKQRRFTKHQFHQGIQHKHHIPTVSGPPETGLYIIHCNNGSGTFCLLPEVGSFKNALIRL